MSLGWGVPKGGMTLDTHHAQMMLKILPMMSPWDSTWIRPKSRRSLSQNGLWWWYGKWGLVIRGNISNNINKDVNFYEVGVIDKPFCASSHHTRGPHARTTIVRHHGNARGQAMVSSGSTPQFVLWVWVVGLWKCGFGTIEVLFRKKLKVGSLKIM